MASGTTKNEVPSDYDPGLMLQLLALEQDPKIGPQIYDFVKRILDAAETLDEMNLRQSLARLIRKVAGDNALGRGFNTYYFWRNEYALRTFGRYL